MKRPSKPSKLRRVLLIALILTGGISAFVASCISSEEKFRLLETSLEEQRRVLQATKEKLQENEAQLQATKEKLQENETQVNRLKDQINTLNKSALRVTRREITLNTTGNEVCNENGELCIAVTPTRIHDMLDRFCGYHVKTCNSRLTYRPGCNRTMKGEIYNYDMDDVRFAPSPGAPGICAGHGECLAFPRYSSAICTNHEFIFDLSSFDLSTLLDHLEVPKANPTQ